MPEQFLDFLVQSGFTMLGFNTEEIENDNDQSSVFNLPDPAGPYRDFISRLFRHWRELRDKIRIREFDHMVEVIEAIRKDPNFTRQPDEAKLWRIITIDRMGNLYPYCPGFAGVVAPQYNNFIVGNVLRDELDAICAGQMAGSIKGVIEESTSICRGACAYYRVCGGGYCSNKFAEHKTLAVSETRIC